ncbi:hypothetical protein KKE92_02195 [Candidatus Micrarchaeota archaeon]|nr:hypothetical protein [Candidatus Micrarchaeota archaeon]MBU1681529.1 hypothetical protein [Candidatus Micrarchaeota archaeon]
MDRLTRKKLERFDRKEAELTTSRGKMIWGNWHGQGPGDADLKKVSEELAALQRSEDYYKTLKSAMQSADPKEKREIELRLSEALYNAVMRDPEVNEAKEQTAKEFAAFRYEFAGVEMTKEEIVSRWQTEYGPVSKAIYLEYLEQSTRLRGKVLDLVRLINQKSREYGAELGLDVKSFAEVIMLRNDMVDVIAKSRFEGLLYSTSNIRGFLDNIKEAFGIPEINPLNDILAVNQFYSRMEFWNVFPSGDMSLSLFKHVLYLSGFSKYFDVTNFGNSPHVLEVSADPANELGEGALRLAKGNPEYLALVNPFNSSNPRAFTAAVFHEGGHVLHYDGLDRNNGPDFFKTDTEAFREGMAMVVETLLADPYVLHEMSGAQEAELDNVVLMSRFLDATRMREFVVGGLLEMELYRNPEGAIDKIYLKLVEQHSISGRVPGIPDETLAGAWASDERLVLQPGARIEYALGYGVVSAVMSSLAAVGEGTMMHNDTARILHEYCYSGLEVPWQLRIKKLLEDTGMKPKDMLQ